MKLFFDLDGTLIDARLRLFQLFSDITGQTKLDINNYWELKRGMHYQKWILSNVLNFSEEQILEFRNRWMELIETEKYLNLNTIFPFTKNTLAEIKKHGHELYIVTARHNEAATYNEISKLGIQSFFEACICAPAPKTKASEILKRNIVTTSNDIFIGDAIEDIETAKKLNLRSIAVLSGFYNLASLMSASPDLIMNNISELPNHINQ